MECAIQLRQLCVSGLQGYNSASVCFGADPYTRCGCVLAVLFIEAVAKTAAVGAPAIGAKLPAQRMATSRGMKHTTTTPSAPCLVAACEQHALVVRRTVAGGPAACMLSVDGC
eukprot:1160791-Pelagomonas_calceolata.AAC.16